MTTHLAEKLGHAPRRTLAATFLFLVLAAVFGGPVAGALDSSGGFAPPDADSVVAIEEIEAATGQAPSPGLVLLVTGADGVGGIAPTDARLAEVAAELESTAGVVGVVSGAGAPAGQGLVSEDGSQVLVLGTLSADADQDAVADEVLALTEDSTDVAAGGATIANFQLGSTVGEDLGRAETYALPILIVLSILFFGGRAAWMPLLVGATTVLGTFLALAAVNQAYDLNIFALNLVIGLGLGLAIDYSLFLVTRYREEVARQGATTAAIVTTMNSAGRTVIFSAATVAVALATLTVFPLGFLQSMGIAGATVAVVAAAASLVISPALFGLWGAKLVRRSVRKAAASGSTAPADERTGRWYRLSHAVMRRPGVIAGVTTIIMLVLAAPALSATWTPVDSTVVPTSLSARTVSDRVEADFSGSADTPMTISVTTASGDRASAVTAYAASLAGLDGVRSVAAPVQLDADSWQIDVAVTGGPSSSLAQGLVDAAREVSTGSGLDAKVAGPAADFVDQQDAIGSRLLLAGGLLVGLTLIVLWLMTGSVVLPVKAVIMNILTVGSALGALVFVFQGGRFADFLGYTPNGGIEPTDFLVATALIFALSTDYGVFLMGRIKEARTSGLGERESVAVGLQRTGAVVTAAAILLAVAIGAFATSSISFIQQIGVATAFSVLVDAFVVRSLLVPALMGLLGKWNWWAPMPLRRLHDRIGFSEEASAGRKDQPELVSA